MKKVIAYINWQQYAFGDEFKLPKTLCSTFWQTLFGVLMIPATIWGNIYNEILYKFNGFDRFDDYVDDRKINAWISMFTHVLILTLGPLFDHMLIESESNPVGWISRDSFFGAEFLLQYFIMLGLGITSLVFFIIVFGLVFLIIWFMFHISEYIQDRTVAVVDEAKYSDLPEEDSFSVKLVRLWLVIKNKICPIIDWEDIHK